MNSHGRIAIIGAGITGLACANALKETGADVVVFDKSRGLGGRLASRRGEGVQFDHGAQYITARSPAFSAFMEARVADGSAALWQPQRYGERGGEGDAENWYVGLPGMSGLVKPLAAGLDVRLSHTAKTLRRDGVEWSVAFEDGAVEKGFTTIVLAIPAEQARVLVHDFAASFPKLADVVTAPCLAAMAAFDEPTNIPYDARRFSEGPLAWVARNSTKPSRPNALEQWVFHASPDWSRAHLEHEKEDIADRIIDEAQGVIGPRGCD